MAGNVFRLGPPAAAAAAALPSRLGLARLDRLRFAASPFRLSVCLSKVPPFLALAKIHPGN